MRVGTAGLGTVAQGVLALIKENRARIEAQLGHPLHVTRVASRTPRPDLDLLGASFNTDLGSLIADDVDVVIELIGGVDDAFTLLDQALTTQKHVVTANKALLAERGNELFDKARNHKLALGFEASVAGGIPVIDVIKTGLAGNQISSIVGIVNGTSNYILSAMSENGTPFEDALKRAQELGYAEMDPTFDVEGIDAAQKLSLLTALAFDKQIDGDAVYTEGISSMNVEDLQYARELGFAVKHVAIAQRTETSIDTRVHLALISDRNLLSQVSGVQNAVQVEANGVQSLLLVGPGAGSRPTASSVMSDVIAVGNGSSRLPAAATTQKDHVAMDDIECANYVNIQGLDVPGVMATISDVLAKNQISIEAVIQKMEDITTENGQPRVPVVLLTNRVKESVMQDTLKQISQLPTVSDTIRRIRVLELD